MSPAINSYYSRYPPGWRRTRKSLPRSRARSRRAALASTRPPQKSWRHSTKPSRAELRVTKRSKQPFARSAAD